MLADGGLPPLSRARNAVGCPEAPTIPTPEWCTAILNPGLSQDSLVSVISVARFPRGTANANRPLHPGATKTSELKSSSLASSKRMDE